MYTVVGKTNTRTFRVLWMLEELGQPYTHLQAPPQSPDAREFSQLGKIPLLKDGDTVLRDSAAILTYLADKHQALTAQAGTLDRARQDAWTFRVLDECDSLLWTAGRHSFVLPEEHRVPAVKPSIRWEFARNIERLTPEITGPFLMGEQITVPDILLTHCANWAQVAKFPEFPSAFQDYVKRLRARPAYVSAQKTAQA